MRQLLALLMGAAGLSAATLTPFPLTIPVAFEENRGQSPTQFTYVVTHANIGLSCDAYYQQDSSPFFATHLVSMRFLNAARNCTASLEDPDGTLSRYNRGANQTKSIDPVLRYGTARFKAVWPGIDVEYAAGGPGIVATIKLARASDIDAIRLEAGYISVDSNTGSISSSLGRWPVSAEQNGPVAVRAVADQGVVSFTVATVSPALPLTLRLGIPASIPIQMNQRHAVDREGNRYVASNVFAYADLDTAAETCLNFQLYEPCPDTYVASFDPAGKLRYLAYFLGSRYESIYGITSDSGGNIFVSGTTYSKDFVITAGAYQATYSGPEAMTTVARSYPGGDAFVAKLHGPSGRLLYSTYIGSENEDRGGSIFADAEGRVTVAVWSAGSGLPLIGEPVLESNLLREADQPR